MKQEVIREQSTSDLLERLEEEKMQLTKLRLNHAVSPLENPNMISVARKGVARIMTELNKRETENK